MDLKVKILHPGAKLPTAATRGSVGLDLYLPEDFIFSRTVYTPGPCLIKIGIAVEIPYGYEGQIRGRSGRTIEGDFLVLIGTIDSDYRGEIGVAIMPLCHLRIAAGERVAQLVVSPVTHCKAVRSDMLTETARGGNGHGSTGK